jgi:hypothetical protein
VVLADALQEHLLIADVFFDLVAFPGEGFHQVAIRALGHDVRHLLDSVSEVFKPKAVEKEVYVPGVVVPVVVDRILFGRNNAFFLIVSDQIRRYAEDSGHISYFIAQDAVTPIGINHRSGRRKKNRTVYRDFFCVYYI